MFWVVEGLRTEFRVFKGFEENRVFGAVGAFISKVFRVLEALMLLGLGARGQVRLGLIGFGWVMLDCGGAGRREVR